MAFFNPASLHFELDALATALSSRQLAPSDWDQIEVRVEDMIENVTRLTRGKHPYSVRAQNALSALQDAQERVIQRSASTAAEAFGRASLRIRGEEPTRR